jgi:hypothetical protein
VRKEPAAKFSAKFKREAAVTGREPAAASAA